MSLSKYHLSLFFLALIIFFLSDCKSAPKQERTLPILQNFTFLDSTQAASRIIQDSKTTFFNQINKLDMSIQLKRNFPDTFSRDSLLVVYKKSLQTSVGTFSQSEKEFINQSLNRIFTEAAFDLAELIDNPIAFLKMSGQHYGKEAYYTRENCILIPEAELKNPIEEGFDEVIIHELFHIYSRYHPEQQKALYELIGFKSIGDIRNLQMTKRLKERVLLNPDGVNYAYAIQLEKQEKAFQAIPLIISSEEAFDPNESDFFNYLQFDLYKIQPPYSRLIKVESTNEGLSLINYNKEGRFREQIGDNTDYIIHPDEVLADNFILLLKGAVSWKDKSPRGQEILQAMQGILFEN